MKQEICTKNHNFIKNFVTNGHLSRYYGKQTNSSIMKNAKYVNNDLTLITNANVKKDIRPVIVISSKNILGD